MLGTRNTVCSDGRRRSASISRTRRRYELLSVRARLTATWLLPSPGEADVTMTLLRVCPSWAPCRVAARLLNCSTSSGEAVFDTTSRSIACLSNPPHGAGFASSRGTRRAGASVAASPAGDVEDAGASRPSCGSNRQGAGSGAGAGAPVPRTTSTFERRSASSIRPIRKLRYGLRLTPRRRAEALRYLTFSIRLTTGASPAGFRRTAVTLRTSTTAGTRTGRRCPRGRRRRRPRPSGLAAAPAEGPPPSSQTA